MNHIRSNLLAIMLATTSFVLIGMINQAIAATAEDLDKDSHRALEKLYEINPVAKSISRSAKAVLVFPNIVKAGLVFGGSYGEGELIEGSKVAGYYNTVSGTWGLQAGAQSYGYVMFLMTNAAVKYLRETHGWEIGVGGELLI
jgi:lipid-binding SYLF domain-containing protein